MFWICSLQVPSTCMTFPSALMSSIIFVVSGIISILFFFTNFASTQSIDAPVSGNDCNVNKVLLFVFTFKLINGVGDSGTSAYDIGKDTKFLPLVVVLIDAAIAENLYFCFLL